MTAWLFTSIPVPDPVFFCKARNRQAQLTKPPGSLGMLEQIAQRLAAMQRSETPTVEKTGVTVFAADHGVAEESVSAFSQAVTGEMVKNFAKGGAAVNVLSKFVQSDFEVVDVGLVQEITENCQIISDRAGPGTANFTRQPAMTEPQLVNSLKAGRSAVIRACKRQAELFIGGEMGIANTTSASAIAAALLGVEAALLTGAGTGLDEQQTAYKIRVIESALNKHRNEIEMPLKTLQYLGGFEIAALVGAYIFAAQQRLPVVVDGFIATVAALTAIKINPQVKEWFFFGHCSQEKGHRLLLQTLQVHPILNLDMRLGEASGALTAVPIIQLACRLHNEMATFAGAQISTK